MMMQLRWLISAWLSTRDGWRPPLAIFTATAFMSLAGFLFVAVSESPTQRIAEYRDAAQKAWAEKQYEQADLLLRKAVYLGDASPATIYQLGLIAEQTANLEVAQRRMESIAPRDKAGYGNAHFWLATHLAQQTTDANVRADLVHHLRYALDKDPKNNDAHAMLAELYLAQAQPDLALSHLQAAVVAHPGLAVTLARLRAAAGSRNEAIRIGERAATHYQVLVESDPHDLEARLKLAELKTFLEHWADAERVLSEGMALSQDERLRSALAKVYAFRADLYQRQQPASVAEQLKLLESAVPLSPQDAGIAQRLTRFLALDVPLSEIALTSVKQHWSEVLSQDADSDDAHLWLGQVALRFNDHEAAIEHFQVIAKAKPELFLPLARLHRLKGENESANDCAAEAERTFSDLVTADPDNLQARLLWADAQSLRSNWPTSVETLKEGLARTAVTPQQRGQLQLALSKVYTAWGEQLGQTVGETSQRIEVLARAIELAAGNLTAHEQLGKIIEQGSPEEAAAAKAEIERLIAAGKSTGLGHMILGGAAVERNDLPAARLHFEQAHRTLPEVPECMNNLAWILLRTEPANFERALELIDQALLRQPNSPEFLETRGEIYVRLDRPSDAISDLEITLRAFPDRPRTHELLATAYEQTGSTALAKRHHELSRVSATP